MRPATKDSILGSTETLVTHRSGSTLLFDDSVTGSTGEEMSSAQTFLMADDAPEGGVVEIVVLGRYRRDGDDRSKERCNDCETHNEKSASVFV
jgi:hypothetical protein